MNICFWQIKCSHKCHRNRHNHMLWFYSFNKPQTLLTSLSHSTKILQLWHIYYLLCFQTAAGLSPTMWYMNVCNIVCKECRCDRYRCKFVQMLVKRRTKLYISNWHGLLYHPHHRLYLENAKGQKTVLKQWNNDYIWIWCMVELD